MIIGLRRRSIMVLAGATAVAAALAVVAHLAGADPWAVVLAGAAVVGLAGLPVLVARQVHRDGMRTRADVASAMAEIRRGLAEESSARAEMREEVVPAVEKLLRSQAQIASNASLSRDSAASRALDLRFTRLHSAVLTDAQAVLQLMRSLEPREPLPVVGGWAMSPSGLLWLTRHIASEKPTLVVECGSGTSTLWCAMALRETGRGRLVAFEHQPEFAQRTRDALAAHGLSEWAEVIDAPLSSVKTPRGEHLWYSIDHDRALGASLLLVDGPPGSTGPCARYPAVPMLVPQLADQAVILVDDMHRSDEQEAVALWLDETAGLTSRGPIAQDIVALDLNRE